MVEGSAIGGSTVHTSARSQRRARRPWLAPIVAIALLALWQLLVTWFKVPGYLLPAPTKVFGTLIQQWPQLFLDLRATAFESLAGFLLGNVVAIVLAISFVEFRALEESVYPIAVAIRTVPIIAITPILTLLLGTGWEPKVAIAALITFFPTLVDMLKGLTSVEREVMELTHVLDASRWYVLWRIRFPASSPYLFAALKIAATSCVLGAVVAEWIGAQVGLGYVVVLATYDYRGDLLYAGIFLASMLALVLFGLVSATERRLVRWHAPAPGE